MLRSLEKTQMKLAYANDWTIDNLLRALAIYPDNERVDNEKLGELLSYYLYEMPRYTNDEKMNEWYNISNLVGKAFRKQVGKDEYVYYYFNKDKMACNNFSLLFNDDEEDGIDFKYHASFHGVEMLGYEICKTRVSWNYYDISIAPEVESNMKMFDGMKEISVDYYLRLKNNVLNQYKVLTEKTAEDINKESK